MGRRLDYVFTPKDIRSYVDITYKQLEYWDKTNLINPSIGTDLKVRLYSLVDIVFIHAIKTLRATGNKKYSVQALRDLIPKLRAKFDENEDDIFKVTFLFHPKVSFMFTGKIITPEEYKDFTIIDPYDFIKDVTKKIKR